MSQQVSTFSLRPATADDLQAVYAIESKSYPLPWTEKQFATELNQSQSRFLVYTDDANDEVVAGYIVYWNLGEETHLLNVTVSIEWRGLGMAKKLMAAMINEAYRGNHKRIYLEVRESNAGAISLYESMGFQKKHVKNNFYDDGESAIFMELALLNVSGV